MLQVELSTHIYYKNTDQLKQDHYSWTQNLFTTATLGTEESGRHGEMTVVERFKRESMYGLSAKKVAVVERWALVEVRLFNKFVTRLENKRSTHRMSHKNVNPKIALKTFKVVCQYDSRVACERLIPVCGHCPTYYQAIVWFVLLIFCSTYWERFRQRNALVGTWENCTWKRDKRKNLVDSNNVTAPHRGGASRKTVYEIKNLPWHKGTPIKTTSNRLGMRSPMSNAINYWFDLGTLRRQGLVL